MSDSATEVWSESATIQERFALKNEDVLSQYTIDPYRRDVDDIPIDELDPTHPSLFEADTMWPYFERLRNEDPVHKVRDTMFGTYWCVTKYQDIVEMERNVDVFSSEQRYGGIQIGGQPYDTDAPDAQFNLPMFIMMDPPKHTEQRSVVQPMFLQRPLQSLKPMIGDRVCAILDSLPIDEEFDWVSNVSIELTAQMLATLLDVPQEDRMKLIHWSDTVQNASNPVVFDSIEEAFRELWTCHAYFSEIWEERKREKKPENNLISMLAHGEATRDMKPNELLGNLLLLIVAGNDTTRNSISGGVQFFDRYPSEREKLAENPDLVANAISEIIRFQSPVAHMARTALSDYELNGKSIKAGDRLAMWYISGNRDDEAIPDANSFQIDRDSARNHLGFGFGIHRCLGYRLAEMQLQILWEEIGKRFERIEVVGEPKYGFTNFLHAVRELPVRLHVH